jgi:hypothetical protein
LFRFEQGLGPALLFIGGRLSAYDQLAVVKGMAVQNGGLWVQSPELELRDLPGDTPNRLRKARAKELSES